MDSIKELLDGLPANEREQLMTAFEHQLSQYVRLKDGRLLGVNVDRIQGFQKEAEAGVWAVGRLFGVAADENHRVRSQAAGW